MRVVIIGGAGNIGLGGVIPALQKFGHDITIITRNKQEIPGIKSIQADYRAPGFAEMIRNKQFDAAISMITKDRTDAEILLECGTRQLVFISTVCVMGGPLAELPALETTPVVPITKYGVDKRSAELVLLGQNEIPVTIFRPASTVGPRFPILRQLAVEPDSRWIYRLQEGSAVVVADDGLQKWSWCSADDAGLPIAACLGREQCFHQIYVLTRPDSITWVDYHERVAAVLGCQATKLVFIPSDAIIESGLNTGLLREQSRWHQCYDVSKLLRDFPEFAPTTEFETVIERCLDYLRCCPTELDRTQDKLEDQLVKSWTK